MCDTLSRLELTTFTSIEESGLHIRGRRTTSNA
jgi:hypothetical protein